VVSQLVWVLVEMGILSMLPVETELLAAFT
jgi:hypothetical protein